MRKKRTILFLIFAVAVFSAPAGCKSKKPDTGPGESGETEKLTSAAGEESSVGESAEGESGEEEAKGEGGKKVLMIIACKNFRDEEFQKPKELLQKEGFEVTVASDAKEGCKGMLGAGADVDALLGDVSAEDFQAVVFIGGTGAKVFFDDAHAHQIAQDAAKEGKVLGAICIAPSILAKAGVLKNKMATVWSGDEYISILKDNGCEYAEKRVIVDGNIVTASGPDAAATFGEKLVDLLR